MDENKNSRYLVQLTRQELVEIFSTIDQISKEHTDSEKTALREGILQKLAHAQENGPVAICEAHQTPMFRMKGKRGSYFWSCHQRDEEGNWCSYRPHDRKA